MSREEKIRLIKLVAGHEINRLTGYVDLMRRKDVCLKLYADLSLLSPQRIYPSLLKQKVEEISRLFNNLKEYVSCEMIDTSRLAYGKLLAVYEGVAHLAIKEKFKVRDVFWNKGLRFGREVPALLVYRKRDDKLIDVYPKRLGFQRALLITEIKDFVILIMKLKQKDATSEREVIDIILRIRKWDQK